MSKYTINDVSNIIPVDQTPGTVRAIEAYLNDGIIPPLDPCLSCEPNHIRKLISLIQVAERNGMWPVKQEKPKPKPRTSKAKPEPAEVDWVEGGYTAGIMSREEANELKKSRTKKKTE